MAVLLNLSILHISPGLIPNTNETGLKYEIFGIILSLKTKFEKKKVHDRELLLQAGP